MRSIRNFAIIPDMSLEGPLLTRKKEDLEVSLEDVQLFGKLLFDRRNSQGKSMSELARQIGVIPARVSAWEQADSFPDSEKLSLIAQAYGIDLEELKNAFKISKKAREMEISARNVYRSAKKPNPDADFGISGNPGRRNYPKPPHL